MQPKSSVLDSLPISGPLWSLQQLGRGAWSSWKVHLHNFAPWFCQSLFWTAEMRRVAISILRTSQLITNCSLVCPDCLNPLLVALWTYSEAFGTFDTWIRYSAFSAAILALFTSNVFQLHSRCLGCHHNLLLTSSLLRKNLNQTVPCQAVCKCCTLSGEPLTL